jgi:hypothetical protein
LGNQQTSTEINRREVLKMAFNPETHRQKTITFPHDIYDDIELLAKQEDRNVSQEIIHLLKFALEKYPVKPKNK